VLRIVKRRESTFLYTFWIKKKVIEEKKNTQCFKNSKEQGRVYEKIYFFAESQTQQMKFYAYLFTPEPSIKLPSRNTFYQRIYRTELQIVKANIAEVNLPY
jgi:hypothetical protein